MDDITWEIAHSVETHATRAFAWEFMSNVANWNDPPAHFQLDGPFVTGVRGTTQMPDRPPQHWQLADVTPMESYKLSFPWIVRPCPSSGPSILYRIERG